MNDYNDPLEGYEDMSEMEQLEAEQRLLDKAFRNSYKIITGKQSFESILEETGALLVAHDIAADEPDLWDVENMLDHFIEEEEYLKCAYLRDLIKEIKTNANRKQKEDTTKGLSEILDNIIRRAEEGQNGDTKSPL